MKNTGVREVAVLGVLSMPGPRGQKTRWAPR